MTFEVSTFTNPAEPSGYPKQPAYWKPFISAGGGEGGGVEVGVGPWYFVASPLSGTDVVLGVMEIKVSIMLEMAVLELV